MRAVCLMYSGALWRMNIILVGCIALIEVALNISKKSYRSLARCRAEGCGVQVGANVTVALRLRRSSLLLRAQQARKVPSR